MRAVNIIVSLFMRFMSFIVSLLGNIMNILVSLVIILLNVYVSWNHTLELFHEAGFTREGYMDIAGVCAVELTFLFGTCHMIVARIKGRFPRWKDVRKGESLGIVLTSGMGVGLIMWSNIRAGVDYGITGVIIGIAVPLSIILCEMILADAWRSQAVTHEEPKREIHATEESTHTVVLIDEDATQTIDKPHNAAAESITGFTHADDSHTKDDPNEETKTHTHTEENSHTMDEPDTHTPAPLETAIRFREEYGKLPSIRKLAELADCSEWIARQTLSGLKKEKQIS